ncbi:MAG TPA: hypothetical protein HA257_09200 [Candidatus Methanoperedenaceae archaeon]|nr:hypothetical protein [Candidatus Methanoperedenaceae archaeon]
MQSPRDDYKQWIRLSARDVASAFRGLSPSDRKRIRKQYAGFRSHPAGMFSELRDRERIAGLLGDGLSGILVLETGTVAFNTSLFSDAPGIFDYAFAMNRRYFIEGMWFSIITLNSTFIDNANDRVLKYTIHHELFQKQMYEERIAQGTKKFDHEEKRLINIEAKRKATASSGVTEEDLLNEKMMMLNLSTSCPLVPKSFTDTALFHYLRENLEKIRQFGVKSRNEQEQRLGEELSRDFSEWLGFAQEVFVSFYGELERHMTEEGYA